MSTVNQSKRYLGNRSVYFGPDLPETDLEDGFLFYKTGTNAGLYIYKNSTWELTSVTNITNLTGTINDLAGVLNISKGGTGATNASAALTNLGGVTLAQVQTEIQTTNINSLAGVLNISKGGTGATNASAALTNLGGVTLAQVQAEIQTVNRNSQGNKTVSTSTPVGGSDGDIWYQY
jgi:hypothetical protein